MSILKLLSQWHFVIVSFKVEKMHSVNAPQRELLLCFFHFVLIDLFQFCAVILTEPREKCNSLLRYKWTNRLSMVFLLEITSTKLFCVSGWVLKKKRLLLTTPLISIKAIIRSCGIKDFQGKIKSVFFNKINYKEIKSTVGKRFVIY